MCEVKLANCRLAGKVTLIHRLSIAAALFLCAFPCAAQNTISSLSLITEPPTLTSLGFQLLHSGDDDRDATATIQYRPVGESAWRTGYPLFRVLPETVTGRAVPRQFAGSLLDLKPATSYEVQVRVQDPDGFDNTLTATASTRGVPVGPANPRLVPVADAAAFRAALLSAQPGDVITLQAGTYSIQNAEMYASGNAANPIVIRGVAQSTVILDGGNCTDCNVLEIYGSFITLESLTIQNAYQAVRFQGSTAQRNTARRLIVRDVENGINGRGTQRDFYYADNMFTGRVQFPRIYSTDNGANGSFALSLFGQGHAVAHNHISGFANCITMGTPGNRSIDIYGNEIPYCYDDAIETDQSEGNIRVFRNRLTNVYTAVSVQPVFGGPVYIYRNAGYNIAYEPMKFHSRATTPSQDPSGVVVFHNTFASPERALNMGSPLPNHNSVLMNNIFLGPAVQPSGQSVDWVAPLNRVTFDYNGYYPDGAFFFRPPNASGTAATFAGVFGRFGLEQNGRLLTASTLVNGLLGPASFSNLQTPKDMSLAPLSPALDVAARLPGFNDSYSGAGPDLGAIESGCAVPVFGLRPAAADETNIATGCAVTPANVAPNPVSVTMSRVSSRPAFTVSVNDGNGWQDVTKVQLAFGTAPGLANVCAVELDRATQMMYLWNDAGTARLGPVTLGTTGAVQNSRCHLWGAGASIGTSQSLNQMTWRILLAFVNNYGSQVSIFVKADDATSTSGWKNMGFLR